MRVGVVIHATDRTMSPIELAREAEGRGFYSIYLPEHTHIPTSRRTPPPTGDEVLGEEYMRGLDPCVALAAASAQTSRIRLGTGIALWTMGQALALTGYVTPPRAGPLPFQPPEAVRAIRFFVGPIPAVLLLLSIAFAWFYPITREVHASLREQLAQGSRQD